MTAVNSKRVIYVRKHDPRNFVSTLEKRPDIHLDVLENADDHPATGDILAQAHAYQAGSTRDEVAKRLWPDTDLLGRAPNLLVVSTNGAGYDTVNVKACTEAGVLVCNQTGGNAESVAEHALAMLIAVSKRIIQADRAMRSGAMQTLPREHFMGTEVLGRTIGIIGLGNVGRRLAELCKGLLRMKVLAYDPYLSSEEIAARGATKVETLDELLRQADYVSVNCPHTSETRGMMGAKQFAAMQPHAYFITTARGFIHDEDALAEALETKQIAGAGLDVWKKEPPPADHPLLKFDNVLVSPHTAGVTLEARIRMGEFAAEAVLSALDGKRPPRIVNPEAWPAYAKRFEKAFGFVPGAESAAAAR
jgi:D-3-phosphoglycerate dehydrogenase